MFVRKTTVHGVPYFTLAENKWDPVKKSYVQKKVMSLGKLSDFFYQGNTIDQAVTTLNDFCQKHNIPTINNGIILTGLPEHIISSAFDFGIHHVTRHILDTLGITQEVKRVTKARNKQEKDINPETVAAVLTAAVAYHMLAPGHGASELSTLHWYQDEVYLPEKHLLKKDDFYRTLDVLLENKDAIEQAYFDHNRDLFSQPLDLVLFDTTSVYYWGDQGNLPSETDLLQYGFSKDGKGDLKQLIVGVLMTSSGVPIAHEVFRGNMADVASFETMMGIVKEKYHVSRVILVADRGMVSEANLLKLEEMGLGYILGVRMRLLPQDFQEVLLSDLEPKEMEMVNDHLFTKEYRVNNFSPDQVKRWFLDKIFKGKKKQPLPTMDESKIVEHVKKRRIFVYLNPFMEQLTKKKREAFKRIIQQKIKHTTDKEWLIKNGYKKYLTFKNRITPEVNEEKLEHEELFDGKWVLITNEQDISSIEAGRFYQTLQKIERGFHDLKSLVKIRPIYHFKEERMKAHIFVSFLTMVVKWHICRILNARSQEDGRRFLEAMSRVKAIPVDEKKELYIRTEISPELKFQLGKLTIPVPGKILFDGRKKLLPKEERPTKTTSQKVRPGQISLL